MDVLDGVEETHVRFCSAHLQVPERVKTEYGRKFLSRHGIEMKKPDNNQPQRRIDVIDIRYLRRPYEDITYERSILQSSGK